MIERKNDKGGQLTTEPNEREGRSRTTLLGSARVRSRGKLEGSGAGGVAAEGP